MMTWIFILLIIAGLFVFLKVTNVGQNLWSYAVVFGVIFIALTALYVGTFTDVDFSSFEGVMDFGKTYTQWLLTVGGNVGSITGKAVDLNWGLNNTG